MNEKHITRSDHRYHTEGELRLELEGGLHTKIVLLRCDCGRAAGFPDENLSLAMTEGTEETKKLLKEKDLME